MTLRCWLCGAEPTETVDVTGYGDREPVLMPTRWPAADHQHAVEAPSPQALIDEGHRILHRILTS